MLNAYLTDLGKALDRKAWEQLCNSDWPIAEVIRNEVQKGATPEQIKWFVMRNYGKWDWALQCQAAARYLEAAKA